MDRRLELQKLLESILGSKNVYFQPPSNLVMKYPAIVYSHDYSTTQFAGNLPYHRRKRYLVTQIDRDPDSPIPDRIAQLPLSNFQRHFVQDNLHHNAFNIFY